MQRNGPKAEARTIVGKLLDEPPRQASVIEVATARLTGWIVRVKGIPGTPASEGPQTLKGGLRSEDLVDEAFDGLEVRPAIAS